MKSSNDTVGNRSHELLVWSAVPQPLRHCVPPIILDAVKYSNKCGLNSRNFCLGGEVKQDVNGGQRDQAEIPASMGPFLKMNIP
jgi:hypothetical protein